MVTGMVRGTLAQVGMGRLLSLDMHHLTPQSWVPVTPTLPIDLQDVTPTSGEGYKYGVGICIICYLDPNFLLVFINTVQPSLTVWMLQSAIWRMGMTPCPSSPDLFEAPAHSREIFIRSNSVHLIIDHLVIDSRVSNWHATWYRHPISKQVILYWGLSTG